MRFSSVSMRLRSAGYEAPRATAFNRELMQRAAALRLGAQERVVGVLAVDVGEKASGLPQLGQGGRCAVDVGPRAATGLDYPAQEASLDVEVVGAQPGAQGAFGGRLELRGDLRPLGPGPHRGTVRPLPQGEGQGIHENRLAGTGLARERGHARREHERQVGDDAEVVNCELEQHGRPTGPRGGTSP